MTAGSQDKADACLKLGAVRAINYKTEDFVAVVKAETNNAGANVILDMVAGDYVDRNYDAAAIDGRIVQIGGAFDLTMNPADPFVSDFLGVNE